MMRFMQPYEQLNRRDTWDERQVRRMPMDASESDRALTLRFDLPGIHPEDVELTIENRRLKVSAERPFEESDDVVWLRRERPAGLHHRTVRLDARLDTDNVDATFRNGVLTATIPILEEAKPRQVAISTEAPELLTAGAAS